MIKRYAQKKKDQGFTIIEALISIFILSLAVAGPLVFISNNLKAAFLARDQVVAYYLAAEVIEEIDNIRYDNRINLTPDWLDSGSGFSMFNCDDASSYGCYMTVQPTDSDVFQCEFGDGVNCGGNDQLYIHNSTSLYTHDSSNAQESNFRRRFFIEQQAADEVLVRVDVEILNLNRTITLERTVYNWIPK